MATKYGIKLLGYDQQYQDCIITRGNRQAIMDLADKMVSAITNNEFSLMGELNRMQSEVGGLNISDENVFKSKYTIPNYFVNLLLKPYNLQIGIYDVREDHDN